MKEQAQKATHPNDVTEFDPSALRELYHAYAKPMYNIAIRMTSCKEDAEDIVQDSFIKAFQEILHLRTPAAFCSWLRKIVINNCLQHLRKKRVLLEPLEDDNDFHQQTEDDAWFLKFSPADVHEAVKKLPEGCRQIFLLYAAESHSHKEIANMLNISESTSKSQYRRAKKILKTELLSHE